MTYKTSNESKREATGTYIELQEFKTPRIQRFERATRLTNDLKMGATKSYTTSRMLKQVSYKELHDFKRPRNRELQEAQGNITPLNS